jgi:hypothetical protein
MFIVVGNVREAKDQLFNLRKVVSQGKSNGVITYVVDGKDYSEAQLIELANSVVADGLAIR